MSPLHRAFVVVALLLAGCGDPEPPAEPGPENDGTVTLTEAQRGNAGLTTRVAEPSEIFVSASFPATLAPPDTGIAEVGSIVEGRVERVLVVEGHTVARGQPLALIHSHELTDALRDRAAAEARRDYAARSLDRSRRLLEAGAVSLEEVERRSADADAAEAEVDRAREMVEHLDPSPGGDVTVRAPVAGVVLSAMAHPAQAVTPGTPLFSVGPEGVLWATAFVPETEAVRLDVGSAARIRLRALPDTELQGRVVAVGRSVRPDTRSVPVRVELAEIPAGVRSGMLGTVELEESTPVLGVELPLAAVQRVEDREVVFVVEPDGRYRPVPVETRILGPDRAVALGIEPGAEVVVEGAYVLKAALQTAAAPGGEA